MYTKQKDLINQYLVEMNSISLLFTMSTLTLRRKCSADNVNTLKNNYSSLYEKKRNIIGQLYNFEKGFKPDIGFIILNQILDNETKIVYDTRIVKRHIMTLNVLILRTVNDYAKTIDAIIVDWNTFCKNNDKYLRTCPLKEIRITEYRAKKNFLSVIKDILIHLNIHDDWLNKIM